MILVERDALEDQEATDCIKLCLKLCHNYGQDVDEPISDLKETHL